jgi:Uma2 family endonuclease
MRAAGATHRSTAPGPWTAWLHAGYNRAGPWTKWKQVMSTTADQLPPATPVSRTGEPTWEIARFYPRQGDWTEGAFLTLKAERGIELVNGHLEFLPMPTKLHQVILMFLLRELDSFVARGPGGLVLPAGFRVRVGPARFREPDVVYFAPEHLAWCREDFGEGADLVMEIVSADNPSRDLTDKRNDYAHAGIREYWIADPRDSSISVLKLEGDHYVHHTAGKPGQTVASALLPGFSVDVAKAFTLP